MKIGYLMQNDAPEMGEISGPQAHVQSVFEGLQRRGHQMRMVATQKGKIVWSDNLTTWHPAEFLQTEKSAFRLFERAVRGVQSRLRLPYLRAFDSLRFSDACVTALDGYDILYERTGVMNYGGLIAAHRLGVPLVLEANGDVQYEYAKYNMQLSRPQWMAINWLTKTIYNRADHLVAVHDALKARILRQWKTPESHVTVITNGAEYELFSKARNRQLVFARHALQIAPTICFVGAYMPWHGAEILVRAFAEIHQAHPHAQLVMIGDGDERHHVMALAQSLGVAKAVVFKGFLPLAEVADLVATSDIAVAPYHGSWGQTGLKVYEYMSAGRAVVTTAQAGKHATIQHMQTGVLVEPGNVTALAAALSMLLQDDHLRERLGAAAQRRARQHHTWDQTTLKIEQLCEELIESSQMTVARSSYAT